MAPPNPAHCKPSAPTHPQLGAGLLLPRQLLAQLLRLRPAQQHRLLALRQRGGVGRGRGGRAGAGRRRRAPRLLRLPLQRLPPAVSLRHVSSQLLGARQRGLQLRGGGGRRRLARRRLGRQLALGLARRLARLAQARALVGQLVLQLRLALLRRGQPLLEGWYGAQAVGAQDVSCRA